MFFNFGHTFFFESSTVAGASVAGISSIDLYFMYRPSWNNNISGIDYPGITLYLTDTLDGYPVINENTFKNVARVEWSAIKTSSDATLATNFRFNSPVQVLTDQKYAFLVSYDGNDQFMPWYNRRGYLLAGTSQVSPGPSSQYVGEYYEYVSPSNETQPTIEAPTWNPIRNVELKFKVNVARYSTNSYPVFANTTLNNNVNPLNYSSLVVDWDDEFQRTTLNFPTERVEIIQFDRPLSTKQAFVGAQKVYQDTVVYPGGGVYASVSTNQSNTITANASMSNGYAFNWNNVYGNYTGEKYIVLRDGSNTDIRKVSSIVSNTVLIVDEPVTFSNTSARFSISPVATVDSFNVSGANQSLMFLKDSNANSTVRFVSDSINISNTTITDGGTGYSNSDVLYIKGYEYVSNKVPEVKTEGVGNYFAVANLVTNSTGGVVNVNFSNTGAGYNNVSSATIAVLTSANSNPTTNTSLGSGLTMDLVAETTILTEHTNNIFRKCDVIDYDVQYINPFFSVTMPNEVDYTMFISTLYTITSDNTVSRGTLSRVVDPSSNTTQRIEVNSINRFNNTNLPIPAIVSRSNEFTTMYANGVINDKVTAINPYSNSYVIKILTTATNDYTSPHVDAIPQLEFGKYLINNDDSLEHTNSGNSLSKHITSLISLAGQNNALRFAEDLRIPMTVYRPINSNIEVYARIKNSQDGTAFDDLDWSKLEIIDGDIYSSSQSDTDYIDMTFGFRDSPVSNTTYSGAISTTNNSSNVIGTSTTFTTDVDVGSLVKIYDPLFANDNFLIASVTSVTNNTLLTIDQPIVSDGFGGVSLAGISGLSMEVAKYYKHQAFNNPQNLNIVRYYNLDQNIYDGYDSVQLKILLLSSDLHSIPRIHNIMGAATSA